MSDQTTPLVPQARGGLADWILRWSVSAAVRASLVLSPRPAALLVRRLFAAGGKQFKQALDKHAPPDVVALVDQRYGDEDDMLLDVVYPVSTNEPLPLLLWVHGGGWVGGSKDELTSYFKLIASNGYVVVGPRYSLAPEHRYPTPPRQMMQALDHLQANAGCLHIAPEHRYPTPPRQMMQALDHLQANAGRLHIDPARIAIAGDSAGAQIAAQLAALVTTPGYADAVGVAPAITPAQLRGVVLACGPYDAGLARRATSAAGRRFVQIVLWAYSGKRHFLDDPLSAAWSVTDNLTAAFPSALITVGNADPLRPHSELLAEKLRAHGVEPETLFFPGDREPQLGHEYQFDIDTAAGQLFLEHLVAFLGRRLGSSPQP